MLFVIELMFIKLPESLFSCVCVSRVYIHKKRFCIVLLLFMLNFVFLFVLLFPAIIEVPYESDRSIIRKLIEADNVRYSFQSKLPVTWLSMSFVCSSENIRVQRLSNPLYVYISLHIFVVIYLSENIVYFIHVYLAKHKGKIMIFFDT